MSANETPRDPAEDEALRREIQAAIKAGRELDPDMDGHLADSVLDRYRTEQAARAKALGRPQAPAPPQTVPAPGQAMRQGTGDLVARTVIGVVAIGAFVALMAVNWHLWWLVFFLPWLLSGWWGRGRHGSRYSSRGSRRYMRVEQMRSELGQPGSGTIHYD